MNAKVKEVLADTRRIIIQHIDEIDTNSSLCHIKQQVDDADSWFHTYLDYIACFHEVGEISDEEEERLTRAAFDFYKR